MKRQVIKSVMFTIGAAGTIGWLASTAHAQFAFSSTTQYTVGLRPSGIAIGDLDGDGDLDIATSTDTPDKINILLNNGSGSFVLGPVIAIPGGSSPADVLAGDLDGDGDADLAVILRALDQVRVLTNSSGSFALGASAAVGSDARGMDMADIDGDGDLDLGVANSGSDTATVLRNNGDGTFVSITLAQPANGDARALTFGSFTGSGPLGVAVSNHDTRTVNVFAASGSSFAQIASLSVGPNDRPDGITAADLNNDGWADIATVSGDDTPAANRVVVFISNGGGGFSGPQYSPTGAVINSGDIVEADLDCDGLPDLVVTNQDSNNMSLLNNLGGTFAAPMIVATGTRPGRVNAGDFDGDGDADLAVANRDSNNVTVVINTTCVFPLPGDVTGNGVVDVDDLLAVINAWGRCKGCAEDVTADGVVNVDDLLIVINNWT